MKCAVLHQGPNRSQGQALAEFALVIPIVMLLIISLFDIGRAVFTYNAITNAAREGARMAIVNQDVASVQTWTAQEAAGSIADPSTVQVTFYDNLSGDQCDGVGTDPILSIGCIAKVDVMATWQPITPIVGNLLGPMSLNASAALPVEFVCGIASAPITDPLSCPKHP